MVALLPLGPIDENESFIGRHTRGSGRRKTQVHSIWESPAARYVPEDKSARMRRHVTGR